MVGSPMAGHSAARTAGLNRHLIHTGGNWASAYSGAESWIRDVGRPRWPDFAANDEIWACSIADWATHGRRATA
jgi:hypothetical protein